MTFINIFKRSCITCGSTPSCPTCGKNEECILTLQTCDACPKTYCSPISNLNSANSTKAEVGAIAGGVIGGIIVLALIGFYIFYKYYYKPKKQYNKEKNDEFEYVKDEENVITNQQQQQQDKRLSQVTLSTMALSVFTKLSNVIPIAYIPGVTVKYNNSKSTSGAPSIFSDIDNASIVGNEQQHSNVTTAIRAKPRLINVDEDSSNGEIVPKTAVSIINLGGVKTIKINNNKKKSKESRYQPGLQNDLIEEEEEGESVFDLNIALEDSPFHNKNVILEEDEEESSESDKDSIGLSDDDDYDPELLK